MIYRNLSVSNKETMLLVQDDLRAGNEYSDFHDDWDMNLSRLVTSV